MPDADVPKHSRAFQTAEDAVDLYRRLRPTYELAVSKFRDLLQQLCDGTGVKIHAIEARTKTIESFKNKIQRPGKQYGSPIDEITDLAGVRIILYAPEDVTRIGNVIDEQFEVTETVDKASVLAVDQFGYGSLHKVLRLGPTRFNLLEWKSLAGIRVEVQVRTVLQHAWAVTSHQLQYKHEAESARTSVRKLSRIAGLLELADEQLQELRNEARKTSDQVFEGVGTSPAVVDDAVKIEVVPYSPGQTKTAPSAGRSGGASRAATFIAESHACQQIVSAARRAGVEVLADDDAAYEKLSALWHTAFELLNLKAHDLVERIAPDAETIFQLLLAELKRECSVSTWRANAAQIVAAATVLSIAEPKWHMHLIRGWPRGYQKALRAVMHRVA